MTAIDQKTTKYLDLLIEFIELTEGSEGLQKLTTSEGISAAMFKYNEVYEKFVTKFLNAPKRVKDIILEKIGLNIWLELNEIEGNAKIEKMISEL